MQEGHRIKLNLDEGSSQREQIVSYVPEQSYCSKWDQELENLQKNRIIANGTRSWKTYESRSKSWR